MSGEMGNRLYSTSSRGFVLELIIDFFDNPIWRRKIIVLSFFLIGSYLVLTQGGKIKTETVVFNGWDVQGYGYYTTGHYNVCTDLTNRYETEFKLYHFSFGSWSPLDKVDENDEMDIDRWYIITYQKTLLGNKLIKVENN